MSIPKFQNLCIPYASTDVAVMASQAIDIAAIESSSAVQKDDVATVSSEAETVPQQDASAADTSFSLKQILEEFYRLYNPEKISSIETILLSYESREALLLNELKKKYGLSSYAPFDQYIASRGLISGATTSSGSPERTASNLTDSSQTSTLSGLAAITSGVQDISSNLAGKLKGWGLGADVAATTTSGSGKTTSTNRKGNASSDEPTSSFTSSDEILFTNRVNTLQSEVATLESEKITLENTIKRYHQQVCQFFSEILFILKFYAKLLTACCSKAGECCCEICVNRSNIKN